MTMRRIYLTQLFPWLLPLRRRQKCFCRAAAMRLSGCRYARTVHRPPLPHAVFQSGIPMVNTRTGMDPVYQENKIFNLKLAARSLDLLLIRPGETFSFFLATRGADRKTPYREGLTERYGVLTTERGGGLCMLSNLLFWLFLHTPLTVVERHGHEKKDFPEPPSDAPLGVDATVSDGWLDLRVRNDTAQTFQLTLFFDDVRIYGCIRSDTPQPQPPEIINGPVSYVREDGAVYEEVDVIRKRVDPNTGEAEKTLLYRNRCRIGYELPMGAVILDRKDGPT